MKRAITLITLLCLLTAPVMAQATYQSLFNEGKNLYTKAKKQWTNRNSAYKNTCTQAINKFKLAKNKTKNQTQIQSCNKWIATCQALQKKPLPARPDNSGGSGGGGGGAADESRIPDWKAITITGITFGTSDKEGNLMTGYGERLYSNLQYLKARVSFRNNVRLERDHIDIQVKIYKPDGTMDGEGSYTFEDYLRADGNYKNNDFDYTLGWGNVNGNGFPAGTYRYEIWIGSRRMYSANFTVYQANSGSGLDNDNSSVARGMSDNHWRTVLKYCVENPTRRYTTDSYKGSIINNKREKYGVYYFGDSDEGGDICFGQWENNMRNGTGLYVAAAGRQINVGQREGAAIYVGSYNNDSRAGQKGTIYNSEGQLVYYGEFDSQGHPEDNYPSNGDWNEFKFECISYDNGAYYIGETYKGDRHGFGVYVWKDKSFWMGNWSYGKRKGEGAYIKYNGTVQTGTWDGDEYTASNSGRSNLGGSSSAARGMSNSNWRTVLERCFENPSRTFSNDPYKGGLYNNDCQDFGAYKWLDGDSYYFGRWDNGERNGYGMHICGPTKCLFSHDDAEIFVGHYSNGRMADGKGTIYDAKGNLKYYGSIENGSLTEVYPSSGDWSRFKFECISYNDGSYYIGETIDGKREGFGVFIWKNKDFWMGFWDDGQRKGQGMYVYYNGNVQTGRWEGDTRTE